MRKCTDCGANLDPMETCDCQLPLRRRVENHIGQAVSDYAWPEVEQIAYKKLNMAERFGKKPADYIVRLAADVYRETLFSGYVERQSYEEGEVGIGAMHKVPSSA